MTTVIRWFSAFVQKADTCLFSQLRWEMSAYRGERAAEWCSNGSGIYHEPCRVAVTPRKDGSWLIAENYNFSRGSVQVGTELAALRRGGTAMAATLTVRTRSGGEYNIELAAATIADVQQSADCRFYVTLYDNPVGRFRIASPVGLLYHPYQVSSRFLSDCWSKRGAFGQLYPTADNTSATKSWHSECFVSGAPYGVLLTERGCRYTWDPAEVKNILAKARSLAKMKGLPLYTFAPGHRDPAGIKRIN